MRRYLDGPIVVFGLITLAALVVSAPASYNLIAYYHSDGTAVGIAATWALLLILEAGAVAAKLATLWVRQGREALLAIVAFALGVNTLSNWLHGALLATAGGMHWAAAWLGSLLYAAFLPGLIYVMLHLICLRVLALRGHERTAADEVAIVLAPVAHAAAVAAEAQRIVAQLVPHAQLPAPQASYPRPEAQRTQPVLTLPEACPACGHPASPMQLRTAAQHGAYRCKGCGKRVAPQ